MLPDNQTVSPAAGGARFVAASDAYAGEEDGIAFWRAFDPSALGSAVFLARARCAPGTRIPPHWHSQDTVACLVEGRAVFRTGADLEHVQEMAAGDWLFVPAGLVHVEETPDDVHGDFLYARDGAGGSTTYVDDA